jgi:hypothetical protein
MDGWMDGGRDRETEGERERERERDMEGGREGGRECEREEPQATSESRPQPPSNQRPRPPGSPPDTVARFLAARSLALGPVSALHEVRERGGGGTESSRSVGPARGAPAHGPAPGTPLSPPPPPASLFLHPSLSLRRRPAQARAVRTARPLWSVRPRSLWRRCSASLLCAMVPSLCTILSEDASLEGAFMIIDGLYDYGQLT